MKELVQNSTCIWSSVKVWLRISVFWIWTSASLDIFRNYSESCKLRDVHWATWMRRVVSQSPWKVVGSKKWGWAQKSPGSVCVCFLSVWLCSVDRFCPDGVSHGDKVQWVYNLIFSNISGKRIFFFLLIMFIDKSQHRFVLALFQLCTNLSTSHCIQRKSVSIFCISHVVTKAQGLLLQGRGGKMNQAVSFCHWGTPPHL